MNRSMLAAALLLLMTAYAQAAKLEVPKNLQDRWMGYSMTLVIAEACSRTQNRPEIFRDAVDAFIKFARDNRVAGAEPIIRESAKKALNSADKNDLSIMMLATPDSCRKIHEGSQRDLNK